MSHLNMKVISPLEVLMEQDKRYVLLSERMMDVSLDGICLVIMTIYKVLLNRA